MSAYVIAEAGCNHLGDMDLAQRMIEAAALAGADCVKFQVYDTDSLVGADDIRQFCRRCELAPHNIAMLMATCENNNVEFLASAFDMDSLYILAELGLLTLKIPSGQIHNVDYLKQAAELFAHKVVFMSTGMSVEKEWKTAYSIVQSRARLVVPMHCVTAYPVPLAQACMGASKEISCFSPTWGYSDHTMVDATCAIIAVAMGARTVEHHFYLDDVDTPDKPASFDVLQLSDYIRCIRDAEAALGSGHHKAIQPCEKSMLKRRDVRT